MRSPCPGMRSPSLSLLYSPLLCCPRRAQQSSPPRLVLAIEAVLAEHRHQLSVMGNQIGMPAVEGAVGRRLSGGRPRLPPPLYPSPHPPINPPALQADLRFSTNHSLDLRQWRAGSKSGVRMAGLDRWRARNRSCTAAGECARRAAASANGTDMPPAELLAGCRLTGAAAKQQQLRQWQRQTNGGPRPHLVHAGVHPALRLAHELPVEERGVVQRHCRRGRGRGHGTAVSLSSCPHERKAAASISSASSRINPAVRQQLPWSIYWSLQFPLTLPTAAADAAPSPVVSPTSTNQALRGSSAAASSSRLAAAATACVPGLAICGGGRAQHAGHDDGRQVDPPSLASITGPLKPPSRRTARSGMRRPSKMDGVL